MASTTDTCLRVIRASGSELPSGMAFLESHYQLSFDMRPEAPSFMFIAYKGTSIVGVFGMMTADRPPGLRLPNMYLYEPATIPVINPTNAVEFGRWASRSPRASSLLVYRGISFARERGHQYAWCEHSPAVHRAARRFGIVFHHVSSEVASHMIEKRYENYYRHEKPSLFWFDLAQAEEALVAYIRSNTCKSP